MEDSLNAIPKPSNSVEGVSTIVPSGNASSSVVTPANCNCSELQNKDFIGSKRVTHTYATIDSTGAKYYGSFDSSVQQAEFKYLGLSLLLLIFSMYLYNVAARMYRHYVYRKTLPAFEQPAVIGLSLGFAYIWCGIILSMKGLPLHFWKLELQAYPSQFVLGFMLPALLLMAIGLFRFSLIFSSSTKYSKTDGREYRTSLIGFIFSILNALASLATIWMVMR